MKEQEIKPLVSDSDLLMFYSENDIESAMGMLMRLRDLYEADRAASRLLIEKLRDYCVQAKSDAADTANAEPDAEINQVWLDGITATIAEANAFLKP